jgi:hypothetical protein
MFNLKQGELNSTITYFAKKYKSLLLVLGYGLRNQLSGYCKDNVQKLFTFYDLDAEGYTTASGDLTIVMKERIIKNV